jgi:sialidase-1
MPARTRTALAAATLALAAALALPAAPVPASAAAADCTTTLWAAGDGGYAAYRIPAIVQTRGVLIAFAEARRNSVSDNGDIEVVERRSLDGGCTWSPQQVVADDWSAAVGNPVPMVTASGSLVLVTDRQGGTVTQDDIQAGTVSPEDARRVFVQASLDAGVTWSARREITSSVKRDGWRWLATGPGHGITIQHGVALGRLVVPADHTLSTGDQRGIELMLSDDGGRTWRLGGTSDQAPPDPVLPDETTGAELPDGRLYLSSRNVGGAAQDPPLGRGYTYSLTSGSTLSAPVRPMYGLVTPEVEGSLLQDPGYPAGVSCAPLLYSGPEDPAVRQHLTIRRSDDGGITWRTVIEVTGASTPAAYSDIVKTSRTNLGVLHETWDGPGLPSRIDFRTYNVGCP